MFKHGKVREKETVLQFDLKMTMLKILLSKSFKPFKLFKPFKPFKPFNLSMICIHATPSAVGHKQTLL